MKIKNFIMVMTPEEDVEIFKVILLICTTIIMVAVVYGLISKKKEYKENDQFWAEQIYNEDNKIK